MIRTVLALGALAFGATALLAQSTPIEQQSALMKDKSQNYGALNRMAKGENPYDQAKVDAAFAKLSEDAPKISSVFSQNTAGQSAPDSRFTPSPKIWQNKADFDARVAKFVKEIGDAKAKAKSVDDLKAVLPGVSQNCTNCHNEYRVRKS
jgi:cytochrome c556